MPRVPKKVSYTYFKQSMKGEASLDYDEQVRAIAEVTGLQSSVIHTVLDAQLELVERHLEPDGPGAINVFKGLKLLVRKDSGKKAYDTDNPHTGERIHVPASPPKRRFKARATSRFKRFIKVDS